MGLTQLVVNGGGVLEAYFLAGLPGEVKVSLFATDTDDESATYGELVTLIDDVVASRDEVATTLSVAAQKGARQIAVASATGITPGRTYKVGPVSGSEPEENVRVKAVNGTVVVLTAPLVYAHASGVAVAGLRAWYEVEQSVCSHWWANGYAKFISNDDEDPNEDPITEAVDCVNFKIPERLIDLVDVRQVEPLIDEFIDQNLDLGTALRDARDGFLIDFGPDRCRWSLGSSVLKRAAALRFCLDRQHAAGRGEEVTKKIEAWEADYANELNRLRKAIPADADNDGEPNEDNGDDGYPNMAAL